MTATLDSCTPGSSCPVEFRMYFLIQFCNSPLLEVTGEIVEAPTSSSGSLAEDDPAQGGPLDF